MISGHSISWLLQNTDFSDVLIQSIARLSDSRNRGTTVHVRKKVICSIQRREEISKLQNYKLRLCNFILFDCFTSDHQPFWSLFKVKQHVIGCINHDLVVGLCSKLFMRLSHYIHLGYGKKLDLIKCIHYRVIARKTH